MSDTSMTQPGDLTLTCRERNCGQQFVFTVGEQNFYAERQFTTPVRCKTCRQARKMEREGASAAAPPTSGPEIQYGKASGSSGSGPSGYVGEGERPRKSGGKKRRERNNWDD